jgi:hypothetical protein
LIASCGIEAVRAATPRAAANGRSRGLEKFSTRSGPHRACLIGT